jgi:hypothetical protein
MRIIQIILFFSITLIQCLAAQSIPLSEHPRPDFQRELWQNLNGPWQFEFDSLDIGINDNWEDGSHRFTQTITVPFSWGSELSGVEDEADIAWYRRKIIINPSWKGKRIFLIVGASDWETTVWLDGNRLGIHRGGYVPFSFELTNYVAFGKSQPVTIRVDDKRRDFTLYGKQGYGNARGLWQTVYLEARGQEFLNAVHFTPDIDAGLVQVTAYLPEEANSDLNLELTIRTGDGGIHTATTIPQGRYMAGFKVPIPELHLWTPEDPYLYEVEARLENDLVYTYFGMRKISVVNLPGTDFPYIALNNNPIYLQLALDQSYHPDGYYTFPTDQFMKEEILRSKSIGLNGIRVHVKAEIPRKLYWADKLGLLVMQDLPNSWGEPDDRMKAEAEYTLREMIKRDYNHPAIFSWILFNETWGLRTMIEEDGKQEWKYLPETRHWVASMVYLAKSLDPARLVEDNSICCGIGHMVTDINSFHVYLPGWEWDSFLKNISDQAYSGSSHLFEEGFVQGSQPTINSECGNVWGYEGSTGDVDWSWDYHRMINTFRKYPEIAGWLYTEHHDVINEWNGYWRFDRSNKFTGLDKIVEGMRVNDFHAAVYLSTGNTICETVEGGQQVEIPLFLSSMTDEDLGNKLKISCQLVLTNLIGEDEWQQSDSFFVDYHPYMQTELDPFILTIPDAGGLAKLILKVATLDNRILHHNFMYFFIKSDRLPANTVLISVAPDHFKDQDWSLKQWNVLDGLKVNGTGNGYFEYQFRLPENCDMNIKELFFLAELSAKQCFVKDMDREQQMDVDYMRGGRVDASSNPNAYPMTDETQVPSNITISVNGHVVRSLLLPDDPADHRGVLSWHSQLKDRKLCEAGSYGYLIKIPIAEAFLREALEERPLTIRIQAVDGGGVAVYGKSFGRYPVDPSIVIRY